MSSWNTGTEDTGDADASLNASGYGGFKSGDFDANVENNRQGYYSSDHLEVGFSPTYIDQVPASVGPSLYTGLSVPSGYGNDLSFPATTNAIAGNSPPNH
jgi:hypothetical protein